MSLMTPVMHSGAELGSHTSSHCSRLSEGSAQELNSTWKDPLKPKAWESHFYKNVLVAYKKC